LFSSVSFFTLSPPLWHSAGDRIRADKRRCSPFLSFFLCGRVSFGGWPPCDALLRGRFSRRCARILSPLVVEPTFRPFSLPWLGQQRARFCTEEPQGLSLDIPLGQHRISPFLEEAFFVVAAGFLGTFLTAPFFPWLDVNSLSALRNGGGGRVFSFPESNYLPPPVGSVGVADALFGE